MKHVKQIKKSILKIKLNFTLLFLSFFFIIIFLYFKNLNPYNFNYTNFKKINKSINNFNLKNNALNNINNKIFLSELDLKNIKAKAFIVYDLSKSDIVFSKNERALYPLASITKLMTAYIASNDCADNLKKELDEILIASDNEAADRIANSCPNYEDFIKKMNVIAKKNNLDLNFINPSGLDIDDETKASNFGNAISVAKLIELAYRKDSYNLSHTTKSVFNNIKNTNEIAENLPFLIASKTGYTDIAGGNLVTMYELVSGKRFVIVVLGSTKEYRFSDTKILLKSYLNNIK